MQIRLSNFNLAYWQYYGVYSDTSFGYVKKPLEVGTTVCMPNNSAVLGTVVALGRVGPYYDNNPNDNKICKEVEVQWHSGAKKGKVEKKNTSDLANYTAYKACIMSVVDKMTKAEVKAGLAAPK